jgi:pimeloyl-ACP methyl ester carboxylesterase
MSSFDPDKFKNGRKNDTSSAKLREVRDHFANAAICVRAPSCMSNRARREAVDGARPHGGRHPCVTHVAILNEAPICAFGCWQEIEMKTALIKGLHEEKVFDAERHVKDATEEYYEEISLEGDQFLRMDGVYGEGDGAEDGVDGDEGTRFASYRGQRIAYTVTGRPGQPVVLQHGFLSNKEAYVDYAAALSSAGFMVLCTDSLGHGESDKPTHASRYSLANRAGDVAAVLDAEGIEKAHFIGYSMGGWIGTGLAKHRADRLLSLTIGGWDPETEMLSVRDGFDLKRDFLSSRLLGKEARPDLVEWFKDAYIPGLTACWSHLRDKAGAIEALADLSKSVPVMLWTGREDSCHTRDVALASKYEWSLLEVDGDHMAARGEMVHQGAPGLVAFLKSGGMAHLDSDALSGGLLTGGAARVGRL